LRKRKGATVQISCPLAYYGKGLIDQMILNQITAVILIIVGYWGLFFPPLNHEDISLIILFLLLFILGFIRLKFKYRFPLFILIVISGVLTLIIHYIPLE
jgi:hypothetical protein